MFAASKTAGAAAATAANYIEDVFSTYLYTGNGSTQTITNGIDLSGKGGLTWIKRRNAVRNNQLFDTARGATKILYSDLTNAQDTDVTSLTSFNSDGFSLGLDGGGNANGGTYASWTFRKQPKFFDVVTFTQTSTSSNFRVNHSLGSVPGCIIIKCTSTISGWYVYHRSLGRSQYVRLNATSNAASSTDIWGTSDPTSTDFGINAGGLLEGVGTTYVAYIYAHNAGGFGLTGTDNVISCGSYVGNGSTPNNVTLGYEPQWILIKDITGSTNPWVVVDNMRGMSLTNRVELYPNNDGAELTSTTNRLSPTATGFFLNGDNVYYNTNGSTYIYIAIRRGPMKVPTTGTSVFAPVTSSSADGTQLTSGFPIDMQMLRTRALTNPTYVVDRLRGVGTTTTDISNPQLRTNLTNAEASTTGVAVNWNNTGFAMPTGFGGASEIFWNFRRAPSFFDEVCYTGTGTGNPISHNLTVKPTLLISKSRSSIDKWEVAFLDTTTNTYRVGTDATTPFSLNLTDGWGTTQKPAGYTGPVDYTPALFWDKDTSGRTYVTYLFATCAGVSKVGSYTGTGATQTISCGFTGGARFVLIKRTDGASNWYVWDTARGMVSGADPRLALDSTVAEVNQDFVYTATGGFQIVTSNSNVNASGGTYIFLAIA